MVERVGVVGRLVGVSGLGRGGVSHWEGTTGDETDRATGVLSL